MQNNKTKCRFQRKPTKETKYNTKANLKANIFGFFIFLHLKTMIMYMVSSQVFAET